MPDRPLWNVHCQQVLPVVLHLLQLVHTGYVHLVKERSLSQSNWIIFLPALQSSDYRLLHYYKRSCLRHRLSDTVLRNADYNFILKQNRENSQAIKVRKQTPAKLAMVVSEKTSNENFSVHHFFFIVVKTSWMFLDIPKPWDKGLYLHVSIGIITLTTFKSHKMPVY